MKTNQKLVLALGMVIFLNGLAAAQTDEEKWNFMIFPALPKYWEKDSNLRQAKKIQSDLVDVENSMTLAVKNHSDRTMETPILQKTADQSISRIAITARFIYCPPEIIAPNGFVISEGWVQLPLPADQKTNTPHVVNWLQTANSKNFDYNSENISNLEREWENVGGMKIKSSTSKLDIDGVDYEKRWWKYEIFP